MEKHEVFEVIITRSGLSAMQTKKWRSKEYEKVSTHRN